MDEHIQKSSHKIYSIKYHLMFCAKYRKDIFLNLLHFRCPAALLRLGASHYLLYKEGFTELDQNYNFIVWSLKHEFFVKSGVFYTKDNKKIPIVHNSGGFEFIRPIKNFGYGKSFNQEKILIRMFRAIVNFFR